jgi:hypothetical protein
MAKILGPGRNKSREKLYAQIDELYTDVHSDGLAVAGSSNTTALDAGNSVPCVDSTGAIIGYIALYGNAALTTTG